MAQPLRNLPGSVRTCHRATCLQSLVCSMSSIPAMALEPSAFPGSMCIILGILLARGQSAHGHSPPVVERPAGLSGGVQTGSRDVVRATCFRQCREDELHSDVPRRTEEV